MKRFVSLLLSMMLLSGIASVAQGEPVVVTMAAEYDIGFECPVASTLDDTATELWVLMNNCFTARYALRGFNIADGTPINGEGDNYADSLTDLQNSWINWSKNQFAFVMPETVEIIYAEPENYDTRNLRVDLSSSEMSAGDIVMNYETIEGLIPDFGGYLEETTYSLDHSLAVVADTGSFHVIDLTTGTEIQRIDNVDTITTMASLSVDNERIYLATFNNPDDYDDFTAILKIIDLATGDVLSTHAVPSALLYISPDEQYAAAEVGSSDSTSSTLFIVHLPSGAVSEGMSLYEQPRRVLSCENREGDLSDLDFTNDGSLQLTGLNWLPDSSGFVTSHSYGGIGAGGGLPCVFDHSRMRIYTVAGGG